MLKIIEVTGDRTTVTRGMETFVRDQVTTEKPVLNHLVMVVEHGIAATMPKGEFKATLSIDLEDHAFSFKAVPV